MMNLRNVFAALGRIVPATRIVLHGLRHRGELATLETSEAGAHLAVSVCLGVGVAVLALLTGFAFTFAFAAAVWHRDDRGLILAALTLGYLLVAIGLGWGLVRRLRRWQPWAETRRQLDEDGACLEKLLSDDNDASA